MDDYDIGIILLDDEKYYKGSGRYNFFFFLPQVKLGILFRLIDP